MGTGAIARGQVRQKRSEGEIYAAAQAERRSASGCNAFYLSTGEKPDSINLSQKSQEVIRFCFSKRNIFQPVLTQATTFRCVVRHFLVDIRAHSNSYTRVWFFPGFLLKKSQIMQDQSLCAFHLAYL